MNQIKTELLLLGTYLAFFGPKVIVATICGAIIGVEREIKNKVAGIRTNILVCVGSTLFTSLALYLSKDMPNIDVTRVIGQIITGIGFLGGGVIFKFSDKITGVTTASFIWIMSAIGCLVGCGFLTLSIVLTLGLLLTTILFHFVERKINKVREDKLRDNE